MADKTYSPKVYKKQGGDEQVVASGGKQTVESGGIVDFESGAALKIAGVQVTPTAAELNKLAAASFNNKSGYVARVNSGETALEFVTPTAIPVGGTFNNKSGYVARVNSGETAMETVAPTAIPIGGAFANKSKHLARVNAGETAMEYVAPTAVEIGGAFANKSLYQVRVNAGETALEYVAPPTVETLPGTFANHSRQKIRVNAGETALTYVPDGQINDQAGQAIAPALADEGKVFVLSSDQAVTVTLPANGAVAFPIGAEMEFIRAGGGEVTFAITDDTLNVIAAKTKVMAGAWAVAKVRKVAATVWVLSGDLAAAV